VDHIGSLYSINNLTGYLKSLGHKAPKPAVADYLNWFEDAYALFTVRIFDASLARTNTNPKKIYCIDHALVRSISSGILVNSGHLLENLVFITLRRTTPDISYYRTRAGREVDFIVGQPGAPRMLIQVCQSMADPQTRKREVTALAEAMAELKLAQGTIVTRNEEEQIAVDSGMIAVVAAWRFVGSRGQACKMAS
jgi:predicted AAA+ superfamily ATPase